MHHIDLCQGFDTLDLKKTESYYHHYNEQKLNLRTFLKSSSFFLRSLKRLKTPRCFKLFKKWDITIVEHKCN